MKLALAFRQGVTSSEAGKVWFLFNQQLDLPVTKLDLQSFARTSLNRYNVIVLPGGSYSAWDKATVDKLKAWVNDGGTLITFQTATAWAIQQEIVREKLSQTKTFVRRGEVPVLPTATAGKTEDNKKEPAKPSTGKQAGLKSERLDYSRQEDVEGSKRINCAIFLSDLDISHPIAFGVSSRKLFINKNGSTLLLPSANKYATVAQNTAKPLINGYSSKANTAKVEVLLQ